MAVEERINERRLKEAATALAYLRDPKFLDNLPHSRPPKVLPYSTKKEIAGFMRDLYIRLFNKEENPHAQRPNHPQGDLNQEDQGEGDPIQEDQNEGAPPAKRNRSKEIGAILEKKKYQSEDLHCVVSAAGAGSVSTMILNALKTDMKKFESLGKGHRSTMLAQIYRALLSIPPTSCEAERNGIHTSLYHMDF